MNMAVYDKNRTGDLCCFLNYCYQLEGHLTLPEVMSEFFSLFFWDGIWISQKMGEGLNPGLACLKTFWYLLIGLAGAVLIFF